MTNLSAASASKAIDASKISWGWLLALGILMTALGVIGLGMAYLVTLVAVVWFGVLAVVGGAVQVFDAFHHKGWKGMAWHLIIGLVYILAGIVLVVMPVAGAFWLTLFLAVSLVVTGVIRIVMAFQVRDQGSVWLWVLFTGVVSAVLGFLIYGMVTPPTPEALATAEGQLDWLRSWGWVIGLFVAIELIMDGVALISISLAAKSVASSVAPGGGSPLR